MKKILLILILISIFLNCEKIEFKQSETMAQQDLNYGSSYYDPSADSARTTFDKCQDNFDDLYETITKKVNIGVWDMDATSNVTIVLTPPTGYIPVSCQCTIINDSGLTLTDIKLVDSTDGTVQGRYSIINNSGTWEVLIQRFTSGLWDSTDYNDSVMNRGYVVVTYAPE